MAVTQSGFRFGFSGSPFAGIDEVVDAAVRAERAGFDTFVLADLPGALSPLITLAAVAVWCLLIGAVLVWLNYHWFTDVAAGWALAAIIIGVTLRLTGGAYSGLSTPPGVPDERIASRSTT